MVERLLSKISEESKQTWRLAGAAILTGLFQFSIAMVTAAFVGHLGALQLSAISVAQGVIGGFAYGVMVIPSSILTQYISPLLHFLLVNFSAKLL